MESFKVGRGLEWTSIKQDVVLVLFVPLLFVMLLMSACSPYANQSEIATPPPTVKQYYLVLPPDEVRYLFLVNLSSITPNEYANWAGNVYRSSTVKDIGRGAWLISASYGSTIGTWELKQESPFEFIFLRLDTGAKYIEDSVLNSLWDRPNLSDLSVLSRDAHYATVRRPIEAYRAVLRAVNAEANGDSQAEYLRGRAAGLSAGIPLKYEIRAAE